jgi:ribonuclease HepT-like protein
MPSKNPTQRLADIIDNVDAIHGFIGKLDLPAFRADRKTVYAVVRALEIISEASRRLPDDLLRRHPPTRAMGAKGSFPRTRVGPAVPNWITLRDGSRVVRRRLPGLSAADCRTTGPAIGSHSHHRRESSCR